MRRYRGMAGIIVALALAHVAAGSAFSETPSADRILASLRNGPAGVNDYRASVSLTIKGPRVSINDMRMTLYFKKNPTRTHIDADQGVAMIPTGTFLGDPAHGLDKSIRSTYIRSEKKLGRDCHVLKLVRQNPGPSMPDTMLWVDKQRSVIVAIESPAGMAVKTSLRYEMIDGKYYLPVEITADLRPPGGPDAGKPVKATIKFSNYRVNKGISDKVFESKPQKQDNDPHPRRRYRK